MHLVEKCLQQPSASTAGAERTPRMHVHADNGIRGCVCVLTGSIRAYNACIQLF